MSTVTISAADVNKLRQLTGAGMMDCKKALTECGGDFDAAVDWLRKKGQKVSEKRADRDVNEGVAVALLNDDATSGIILALGCETDFVAKNDDYVNFARSIAELALANKPADKDALMNLDLNGMTVANAISEQVGKIGEKIEVTDYAAIDAASVVAYNHSNGKVSVLIGMNKAGDAVAEIGKDVAMQIAAMNPIAIDKDGVPEDVKQREMEIGREQARAEGKPEQILDKIATGKLEAYYKDNTLLNQKFVKDNSKSIRDVLAGVDKELSVTAFKRIALGA
ncbi:MAG: elongation factor Ts [Chitinophagales bacterium]|nr:elongation factor Ts [Chitinophagales bacterium]HAE13427.1 elongation factor Ts [Bacteroidota bacterium]MCB9020114.1 elongation factor Ts [Chitinophagales bacterium]MCB9021517.1 elongation factor Ts [Chitinophagales bacterium]MCB9032046.1 elongation factor Ts [Chitinophagales bacterium]